MSGQHSCTRHIQATPVMKMMVIMMMVMLMWGVREVKGHSSGLGISSACSSMVPGHGVSPQTSASPYKISFSPSSYVPGTPVSVTISACTATGFKGFLIQARRAALNSDQSEAVGNFGVIVNTRQTCDGNRALIHANSDIKTSLTFNWSPPSVPVGHVNFRVTFVQTQTTLWAGVISEVLRDASDATPINSGGLTAASALVSSCASGSVATTTTIAPVTAQPATTTPSPNVPTAGAIPIDLACGQSKGCFTQGGGSTSDFLVSWMKNADSAVITVSSLVQSNTGAWVAVGLSTDDTMGGDGVIGCLSRNDETVQLFNAENTGRAPPVMHSDAEVELVSHRNENGVLTCTFRRPVAASADGKRYDLNQPWTMFFARGLSTAGSLSYHGGTNRFISGEKFLLTSYTVINTSGSSQGTQTTTTPAPSGNVIKESACGSTKGCFSDCSGSSCSYVVSWREDGTFSVYTVTADVATNAGAWVAIGYSSDDVMGGDAVTGCASASDGTVQVFSAVTTGRERPTLYTDNEVVLTSFENANGVLSCTFRRPTAASADNRRFDVSQPWTLLFARGLASVSSGNVDIQYHGASGRFVSPAQYRVSELSDSVAKKLKYPMIKAHGSLMIGAWIFLASVGIVAARFYKPVWKDMLCSQKVWFQIHRTCMVLVFSATVAGFVIIFVEVKGWSELIESSTHLEAHPIMGVIVTGLTVLNPIMAFFRPHPGTRNRPIFNWAHWFVGTSAHVLGVITIFFGVQLGKADGPDYLVYILFGYVGWQVFIELTLEIISCYGRRKDRKEIYEMSGTNVPSNANVGTESDSATSLKRVLFVIHCFIVAAFAAVVIAFIVVGESELD